MKPIEYLETPRYGGREIHIYNRFAPYPEAQLALVLVEKWGMVAAVPEGEDSAGRSKLRLLTPEEITQRAFDTAKLCVEEAHKRGLMLPLPLPSQDAEEDKQ